MNVQQQSAGTAHSGSRRPLRVLMVEDSENDSLLLSRALQRGGFEPLCERVETRQAMDDALQKKEWDLILADHAMPRFSAPEALDLLKKRGLDIPFIIVSGHIDEQTAVTAMKSGAHDYVMKDRLARLLPAVERELREAEVRRARQLSEEELRRAHEELEVRVEKRTADLKAANLKLQKMLEERTRLENELLEIAENERRRIGFDLHDDLGQKLTGASMMVKGLEQRLKTEGHACAPDAGRIHGLITEITDHTHNLAHEFGSLDMQGDDLPAVLKGLASKAEKMFGIRCEFSLRGPLPELPQHSTVQLYKIAQEAVSNAIKHGKAKDLSISLCCQGTKLLMSIKNSGLPFSVPASSQDRMGLKIMNYRANTIGASLGIKPLDKSGTIVSCELAVTNGAKPSRQERTTPDRARR